MQRLLFLVCFMATTNAHAAQVRLRFDGIIVSSPAPFAMAGEPVTGSFWFDTEGRVTLNGLLGFRGREFGYTYTAPAQSPGIHLETARTEIKTGPVLQAELRNYGAGRNDRADEFEILSKSVFEEVSILFRGDHAVFLENSGIPIPTTPRFAPETPFLEYSEVQIRVRNPRRYGPIEFLVSVLPESIARWATDGSSSPPDLEPRAPLLPIPEPATGTLLLLGTLGLASAARRR